MATTLQYRYVGLATDLKPVASPDGTPLPAGSTFSAADVPALWTWDGLQWVPVPPAAAVDLGPLVRELVKLRLGMILAGTCEEPDPADVDAELA